MTDTTDSVAVEQVAASSGKGHRSPAQLAALEVARKKAIASRTSMANERKLEKIESTLAAIRQPKQAPAPPPAPVEPVEPAETAETVVEPAPDVEEPEEEIQYVRKSKAAPKKPKKRIVVVEESSDDEEEIEVRLPPKRKGKRAPRTEYDDGDERYEKTMRDLFSL
ncbi:hypothetical protein AB1Y20_000318 [Prymnesium parvum]|uniref:Uncharacterized protein n=1 Tax=Prymnesium parvum TaxID=97485 RepID=A0AB34K913_PRYPA